MRRPRGNGRFGAAAPGGPARSGPALALTRSGWSELDLTCEVDQVPMRILKAARLELVTSGTASSPDDVIDDVAE